MVRRRKADELFFNYEGETSVTLGFIPVKKFFV